jgi:hypothetical protein
MARHYLVSARARVSDRERERESEREMLYDATRIFEINLGLALSLLRTEELR